MAERMAVNPLCISALTERAVARAMRSDGHSPASGNTSARYSAMADESQIVTSPWRSAGTRPEGEYGAMAAVRVPGSPSGMTTSSKGLPTCFITSQARSDHDE